MDLCKIEIDFGRQSFRVLRPPVPRQQSSVENAQNSPCMDRLRSAYNDQTLPVLEKNRTPPQKRPEHLDRIQTLDTICKESKDSNEDTEMAAGGILTSIHIPSKPDNNFEKVFNSMLPEDIEEQRRRNCTCHKRTHPDVDMNKMMFDLVNSICKGNKEEKEDNDDNDDDQEAKTETSVLKDSLFKRRPTLNILRKSSCSYNFWIGAEYKYDVNKDKLILKFVLIGRMPENGKQMYIDIQVLGGKEEHREKMKLESLGQQTEIGKEIAIKMVSFLRTLEQQLLVTLNIKRGFLRKAKCIDEWKFPLDDLHCIYPRSFWKNVKN